MTHCPETCGPSQIVLLERELNSTINQRLSVDFVNAEVRSIMSTGDRSRLCRSLQTQEMTNISNFARFLTRGVCLEVLLFWKAVEHYKSLFSENERVASASRIFDMYFAEGALRQVNFREPQVKWIKERMREASEDVFDAAQLEAYEMMRLDLWPRYCEEIQESSVQAGEEEEAVATSLEQVLGGTFGPASRHFGRFARETFLHEALHFWLDANDYALLFQKEDLLTRGTDIYDMYMSQDAKFPLNISDALVVDIKVTLSQGPGCLEINNTLFLNAQKEVEHFLRLDVWPRYLDWAVNDGKIGRHQTARECTSGSLRDERILGDREKVREALVELLKLPWEVVKFREIARAAECEESIDFYLEIKEYQLLFDASDFRARAAQLWKKYLDVSAERMVNMPSKIRRELQRVIVEENAAGACRTTFDNALRENLHLISDNIYPQWISKYGSRSSLTHESESPSTSSSADPCCTLQ